MLRNILGQRVGLGGNAELGVIGIGCTGGKHRSVTIARELFSRLSKSDEYGIRLEHRDAEKDRLLKK